MVIEIPDDNEQKPDAESKHDDTNSPSAKYNRPFRGDDFNICLWAHDCEISRLANFRLIVMRIASAIGSLYVIAQANFSS